MHDTTTVLMTEPHDGHEASATCPGCPHGLVQVLDDTQRNRLPTGYVTVTAPEGATDLDLTEAAGFAPRHFGAQVTRHNDGTATVALWND